MFFFILTLLTPAAAHGTSVATNPIFFAAADKELRLLAAGYTDVTSFWTRTVHFGCGTGFHTPRGAIGVDRNPLRIHAARILHPDTAFVREDVRRFGASDTFRDVLCKHLLASRETEAEIDAILDNALRISRNEVFVIEAADDAERLDAHIVRAAAGLRVVADVDKATGVAVWSIQKF